MGSLQRRLRNCMAGMRAEPFAFEHLLLPVVEHADSLLWADLGVAAADNFAESARASLRRMLLNGLTDLCAAPLYERFAKVRAGENMPGALPPARNSGTSRYQRFVADVKAGGFRSLFEEKPVLLRLIATLTRQWTDSSREFASRLDVDLETLRREFLVPGIFGQTVAFAAAASTVGLAEDMHKGIIDRFRSLPMTASRCSHSTASYGSAPGRVK